MLERVIGVCIMLDKLTLDQLPQEIIEYIAESLFANLALEEQQANDELQTELITKSRYRDFKHFYESTKLFSFLNSYNVVKILIKKLVEHYGFIFQSGKEEAILLGFEDNDLSLLKLFLKVLVTLDIRKILNSSEKTLNQPYSEIELLCNHDKINVNPILNFLNAMISIRIGKKNKPAIKAHLEKASSQGLVNSLLLEQYLDPYLSKIALNLNLNLPNSHYLKTINTPESLALSLKKLQESANELNITLPDENELKTHQPKKQFDFYRVHRTCFSWIFALAIDFRRTQKLLEMLERKIIALTEKRILALAQSPHPEILYNNVANKDRTMIAKFSSRLMTLYASRNGKQLHAKSLTKKTHSLEAFIKKDKGSKNTYVPHFILTLYKKYPEFFNQLTLTQALSCTKVISLLSHPSVNLKNWNPSSLYEFLIHAEKSVKADLLNEIDKLPYLFTLFNNRDDILAFINTEECQLLRKVPHGNLILERLSIQVGIAHQYKINLHSDKLSIKQSLLVFLTTLPPQAVNWILGKFPTNDSMIDLEQIIFFVCTNITFQKMLGSNKMSELTQYISDVDTLLTLDTYKFNEKASILDVLIDKDFLSKVIIYFPSPLALMNAYQSQLLLKIYNNPKFSAFGIDSLKIFHKTLLAYDSRLPTILDILENANPEIFNWIAKLSDQYIVDLAQKEILELLANCKHLPKYDDVSQWKKILNMFELMHVNMINEKTSLLQLLLSESLQQTLVPILNLIISSTSNYKDICLNAGFLQAIANADSSHPILSYPADTWYDFYRVTIRNTNLFSYLTSPCNTIYWDILVSKYQVIDMPKQAYAIMNFIEQHFSKIPFFKNHRANPAAIKRPSENQETNETKIKRLKQNQNSLQDNAEKTSLASLIQAFQNINHARKNHLLTPSEEIEKLDFINLRINTIISELELKDKLPLKSEEDSSEDSCPENEEYYYQL